MTDELFIKIVSLLLTLLAAIFSSIVLPYIKSRLNNSQMEQIKRYTSLAVRCAEQIYTVEQWEVKKLYVTQYISGIANQMFGLTLTEEDINVLIEGVVNEVKRSN